MWFCCRYWGLGLYDWEIIQNYVSWAFSFCRALRGCFKGKKDWKSGTDVEIVCLFGPLGAFSKAVNSSDRRGVALRGSSSVVGSSAKIWWILAFRFLAVSEVAGSPAAACISSATDGIYIAANSYRFRGFPFLTKRSPLPSSLYSVFHLSSIKLCKQNSATFFCCSFFVCNWTFLIELIVTGFCFTYSSELMERSARFPCFRRRYYLFYGLTSLELAAMLLIDMDLLWWVESFAFCTFNSLKSFFLPAGSNCMPASRYVLFKFLPKSCSDFVLAWLYASMARPFARFWSASFRCSPSLFYECNDRTVIALLSYYI